MVQFYFLTEVFLLFSTAVLLADKYGLRLLFLINLRDYFYTKKALRRIYYISGLAISIFVSAFPVEPGPAIIGDILPVITMLTDMIYFINHSTSDSIPTEMADPKRIRLGLFNLAVAVIHFALPSVVLI